MFTTALKHYPPGFKIPVFIEQNETFQREDWMNERYKLTIVSEGSGIIRIGAQKEVFIAPALFCLNQYEIPQLEKSSGLIAKTVYFHPSFINNIFTMDNITNYDYSSSAGYDGYWLKAFFERSPAYRGRIVLSPLTAKRASNLFDLLNNQLTQQSDGFFPCRSRSYLIELLFLIEQTRMNPTEIEDISLSNISDEIGEIVLYLFTHYNEKITIEDLTGRFNINRTTLAQRFSQEVGMPVMSYLGRLRITLASLFLRDTAIPVSEIIDRTGFNDPAHFNRTFKSSFGCSPTDYRQQYCWVLKN